MKIGVGAGHVRPGRGGGGVRGVDHVGQHAAGPDVLLRGVPPGQPGSGRRGGGAGADGVADGGGDRGQRVRVPVGGGDQRAAVIAGGLVQRHRGGPAALHRAGGAVAGAGALHVGQLGQRFVVGVDDDGFPGRHEVRPGEQRRAGQVRAAAAAAAGLAVVIGRQRQGQVARGVGLHPGRRVRRQRDRAALVDHGQRPGGPQLDRLAGPGQAVLVPDGQGDPVGGVVAGRVAGGGVVVLHDQLAVDRELVDHGGHVDRVHHGWPRWCPGCRRSRPRRWPGRPGRTRSCRRPGPGS